MTRPRVLLLEPFLGGSHAGFARSLTSLDAFEWTTLTLPGRHWKWRMRGSAAWFAGRLAEEDVRFDLVFASSYVALAELRGLVPSLARTPAILHFHENQLAYPVRASAGSDERARDHHFGFTQLVSALAADVCLFNSEWNRDSFLDAGRELLDRMPDAVRPGWIDDVAARSRVLPIPVELPETPLDVVSHDAPDRGPLIVWPHRFEHDKGPDVLLAALLELDRRRVPFRLMLLGERYARVPDELARLRTELAHRIEHDAFLPDRAAYLDALAQADIALSTARHEFFGVAMVEATWQGAFPLVPDALAYPERYPPEHRYPVQRGDGGDTLADRLESLCRAHATGTTTLRADRRHLVRDATPAHALPHYVELLHELVG